MADDELISAYIDGQLNSTDRAALEARMGKDTALRQQIDVTRLLVNAAQHMPAPALPRYFGLPAAYAKTARRTAWDGRWLFRAASLLSAGLCAVLFAIDAGQWTGRNSGPQQAIARTMTPTQIASKVLKADALPSTVTVSIVASVPMPVLTEDSTLAGQAKMTRSFSVEDGATTPAATFVVANTPEPTILPLTQIPQTPLPILPQPDNALFPVSLLPRVLAALAGLAAMFFAGLGWRQS